MHINQHIWQIFSHMMLDLTHPQTESWGTKCDIELRD